MKFLLNYLKLLIMIEFNPNINRVSNQSKIRSIISTQSQCNKDSFVSWDRMLSSMQNFYFLCTKLSYQKRKGRKEKKLIFHVHEFLGFLVHLPQVSLKPHNIKLHILGPQVYPHISIISTNKSNWVLQHQVIRPIFFS